MGCGDRRGGRGPAARTSATRSRRQLDKLEDKLDAGAFDGMAQGQMQAALDASLQKLKSLIEAG